MNGSRARCADGYGGVACSVCADGYFEQFGRCGPCPADGSASVGQLLAIAIAVVVAAGGAFWARKLLPVDVLKLGLSLLQVP